MKTLFLHIGTQKTGTSSLQRFCASNRAVLARHGIAYPRFPVTFDNVGSSRNGHFLIGAIKDQDGQRLPEEEHRMRAACLDRLAQAFEEHDNVLLSEEHLWHKPGTNTLGVFTGLREWCTQHGCRLQLIVYLRRQDQFAASMRAQQIKVGYRRRQNSLGWEEWLLRHEGIVFDYYSHLERIAAVVGREHISVRVYDRARLEERGGIYADFLGCLGLQLTGEYQLPEQRINVSLTPNIQEIHRIVTTAPAFEGSYAKTFRMAAVLSSLNAPEPQMPVTLFAPEEAAAFLEQFEEGNERIASEYLHQEGPLFEPTLQPSLKWTPVNPAMQGDVTRYFGTVYLLQQLAALGVKLPSKLLRAATAPAQEAATPASAPAPGAAAAQGAGHEAAIRAQCAPYLAREHALQQHTPARGEGGQAVPLTFPQEAMPPAPAWLPAAYETIIRELDTCVAQQREALREQQAAAAAPPAQTKSEPPKRRPALMRLVRKLSTSG